MNIVSSRTNQPQGTCVNALNVRPFDTLEGRARGGIRPGLSKYIANSVRFEGNSRIQDINFVTLIKNAAPNTSALWVRDTRSVAVSNGTIQEFSSTAINTANSTGNAALAANAPFILSATLYGEVFYTDGINYKRWYGSNNIAVDWTVSNTSSLPGSLGNTACRLIETWDGRIVMSGLRTDPNNWFMSAKGDPEDFDYAPANTTELQAVTGAVGVVGKMDDVINCMIPYSEDILIFGCDHSLWQMSGNPMGGGRIDNISQNIGTPFGRPWCRDPEGNVYFFSNRGNIYMMPPYGAKPLPLSDSISPLIDTVNLNTNFIRLEWDDEADGIMVWVTPFTAGTTKHWFFDSKTRGWFPYQYANTNYNPIAVKLFDGDLVGDRVVMLGGEDGYIRFANTSQAKDDGTVFPATVTLGPLKVGEKPQRLLITHISARTDINSVNTKYEILVGDTPEKAQRSEAAVFIGDGGFTAGLSDTHNPMEGGYFGYVKVGTNSATASWALESVNLDIELVATDTGRQRTSA